MPVDNVNGFRREVIDELKQLHSGVYRWPGGNFVSGHEWRDASAILTNGRQSWIRCGAPFSRTMWAPMSS